MTTSLSPADYDVAITRGAPEVLTGELIKDPDDIERFMAGAAA
jgi:hypothetical protein